MQEDEQKPPMRQIVAYDEGGASNCRESEAVPSAATDVSAGGRIVIPAEFRRALHLIDGDEVLISLDDGVIRTSTRKQQLKRVQKLVMPNVLAQRSLA